MQGQMTYRRAKKLNAVFLLLLLATDESAPAKNRLESDSLNQSEGPVRSPEYFEEKMREFERNKFRF